jgi:hypothetical protein
MQVTHRVPPLSLASHVVTCGCSHTGDTPCAASQSDLAYSNMWTKRDLHEEPR